jgi:palmitoyl-protein thioesterase
LCTRLTACRVLRSQVLIPRETGWFGVFANNSVASIVPLEDQPLYKYDFIGLRTLQETGRLHRFSIPCVHNDYTSPCFDKYFIANVLPFVNSTTTAASATAAKSIDDNL